MGAVKILETDLKLPESVTIGGRLVAPQKWTDDLISEEHFIEVKGESHYQHALDQIGQLTKGGTFTIWFQPEPGNKYDSHDMKVMVGQHQIGYIAANEAPRWSKAALALLESGQIMYGEGWGVDTNPEFKGRRGVLARLFYGRPRQGRSEEGQFESAN